MSLQAQSALAGALLICAATAMAQPRTRVEAIQAQREAKQAKLEPERTSKLEARLNEVKDRRLLERLTSGLDGFTVVIGGLATGQGFALGPQFSRGDLAGGVLKLRTSARFASSRAYLFDFDLQAPELAGGRLFAGFNAIHENYPRIDYYGPGPDSDNDVRTHFRRETTRFGGEAGVKPLGRMRLGAGLGGLLVNTGPGNGEIEDRPRTEDVFAAALVPGLADQTNFRTATLFADYDWRDNPGGPRSGGFYQARFTYFDDVGLERHEFRRLHLEAQQYVPFFNKRRVIALRAATQLSFENGAGSSVPFYLQPILGGSDDLRGFRQYRFYDSNSIIANVEYRWEAFTGLDLALFFDAGKVAPKRSQINFHDLETSVGAGMRFNVRNATFIRLDFGVSHEAFRFWFKFGNPF